MKQRLIIGSQTETTTETTVRTGHSTERLLEFESVESAIRQDASGTVLPPQLRERVLRQLPAASSLRPWWKRWIQ